MHGQIAIPSGDSFTDSKLASFTGGLLCDPMQFTYKTAPHGKTLKMAQGKRKGHRATLLKTALTETVYELWKYRNEVSFRGIVNNTHIGKKIMDSIVYRSWTHKKMREYIARLLIS